MTAPGGGPEGGALVAAGQLARKLEDVVAESKAFRADMELQERQRERELRQQAAQIQQRVAESRRQRWALIIIAGLLLVVCVMAFQTNLSARDSRESAAASKRTLELVLGCLDQKAGACGKANAGRTAGYLEDIQRGQRYIVQCARELPEDEYPAGPKFDAAHDKCVADRLKAARATPTPTPRPSPAPSPAVP